MTSLMTNSVTLFLFWAIIAECTAEDLPIQFDDHMALLNGHFDNIQQGGDGLHAILELKGKPVLIPALQKGPVLYFEEAINGNLYRRGVVMRNESSTANRLYLSYYNFTDSSHYKPGTYNTDDLANLTREDFRLDGGCLGTFTQLSRGVIFGQSVDCRQVVNGQHPIYTIYLTCDSFRFVPPLADGEATNLVAYNLKHRGPRYPLIDAPEGFVNPCKDGL